MKVRCKTSEGGTNGKVATHTRRPDRSGSPAARAAEGRWAPQSSAPSPCSRRPGGFSLPWWPRAGRPSPFPRPRRPPPGHLGLPHRNGFEGFRPPPV